MQLNGAAARLGMPGDLVIVISYDDYGDAELTAGFAPRVVFVDGRNRVKPPASPQEVEEARHEA